MRLFSPNKDLGVQSFIVKLLNNNCRELEQLMEGPRIEGRVRLTLVVMVVPVQEKKLAVDRTFTAVTKEFSSTGVALVLNGPLGLDEVVLGFRLQGGVTWVRAKSKHLSPMGGGFFQLGFRLIERLVVGDHPELESLEF